MPSIKDVNPNIINRDTAVRSALQTMPQVGRTGPAATAQVGTAVAKTAAQDVGEAVSKANVALQRERQLTDAKRRTGQMREAMGQQKKAFTLGQENERKLAGLDASVRQELFDNSMQFMKDKAGQSYLNERQLLDWYATKARDENEMAELTQAMQQQYQRKAAMMKAVLAKIQQAEAQAYATDKSAIDKDTQRYIAQAKANARRKASEAANKAKNTQAMIGALSTIGMGVGAAAGGPLGAMVGGVAGAGIGTVLGG